MTRSVDVLALGSHPSPEAGMCLMEAVAFVAGEPHTDHPACACPVLAAYGRRLNDGMTDEERKALVPLVPLLVGTRSTPEVERRRRDILVGSAYKAADLTIHEYAVRAMEARGWTDLADRIRALAPMVDRRTADAARDVLYEVRREARKRGAAADYAAAYAAAAYAAAYAAAAAAAAAAAYAYADADAAYAYAYADAYADADRTAARREARVKCMTIAISAFRAAIGVVS